MSVTIKEIARQTGVSYATVSRALNGKYGVDPETRDRVIKTAQQLNYHPNAVARGLVQKKTGTIGLIIPDITNPFFPEVALGVEEAAQKLGYSVFLCNTNWDRRQEEEYLRLLSEKRADGIILAPTSQSYQTVTRLIGNELPVVYVSDTQNDLHSSSVSIDNERGGYIATRHLIDQGYKTIGYFGAQEDALTNSERLAGYRLAVNEGGIGENDSPVCIGDYKVRTGYRMICDLIRQGIAPRAIFAVNDLFALGILQGIHNMQLNVPQDIALVGFDDITLSGFPEISLTTISQPKYEMGWKALELLHGKIRGENSGENQRIILQPELIIRRSSGG